MQAKDIIQVLFFLGAVNCVVKSSFDFESG